MKKTYLFVALFAVWCLASAMWFMFWVKGLSPNPANINPHESAWAIAEILIMSLVSLLLGFAIAWYLRQDMLVKQQEEIQSLHSEKMSWKEEANGLQRQAEKAENTLARARETFRDDFSTASREKEKLQADVESGRQEATRLKEELLSAQAALQNLQQSTAQLERTLNNEQRSKHELEVDLEAVRTKNETKEAEQTTIFSNRIFAAQIEKDDIDDLKEIIGIGPVIEKKLNILGIVSFKQVSEFTDEAVDQITQTLKFFPGRIKRDRWVKQAYELHQQKLKSASLN